MKKHYLILNFILFFSITVINAQNTISGKIINSTTKEKVSAVLVKIKNAKESTYSDEYGRFQLSGKEFPLTVVVSSLGFQSKEVEVKESSSSLVIEMDPGMALDEIIVTSASRVAQRKLSSPVTIEQVSLKEIKNSPQLNYIDMVQGLKGVDVTVSSIGFTSITTRGFNTSGNTNFTQIVDGMDNQAPGLNFPLGSALGPNQLDVDNIEVLSGASSALYGSRGLNGTMVTTSKNPFKYQGLSVQVTQGINHVGNNGNDPVSPSLYSDYSFRWAKKINERLAFKVSAQYTDANDWVATNADDKNGMGPIEVNPNYNGINYYGSNTSVNINPFLEGAKAANPDLAPLIDPLLTKENNVARTGYPEYNYLDNNAKLFKANAELRYKISPNLEAIGSVNLGQGTVVYTNDTRYQIKDFKVAQYKAELKSDDWFFRTYATTEDSGNTLIAGPTAQLINEAWKPSYDPNTGDGWYPQYTMGLLTALAGGASVDQANLDARSFADIGRPALGSTEFNSLKDQISSTPTSQGGTLFTDKSKLYNSEFQYNFSKLITFADIIAGANWRLYNLNSQNTLFPDEDKPINVNEYSGYISGTKKVLDDKLNIGISFRVDKNSLFEDAKTTSRASLVYEVAHENFLRFSFQNAYSFPSNIQALQSTLIGMNQYASGGSKLLLVDTYHFDQYKPYTAESVQDYQNSGDASQLKIYNYKDIRPQSVNSFEVGYAALINKIFLVDVLAYYSKWENFIGYVDVANTPGSTDPTAFQDPSKYVSYNIAVNGAETVSSFGYAASVSVDFGKNFIGKVNYYSDHLTNNNDDQVKNFNTPNYHINVDLTNTGFGKKQLFAFGTSFRYKPSYEYAVTGNMATGEVPSSAVIDAQLSYKLVKANSAIRIGGTNITNQYYYTGTANPGIGAVYYVSLSYNVL
ncbi:TonB-dependent receptor plug domain-containing protein [Flavobacterium granuli]|uniref:Outer membrane receptor for ferrienterochelin and colicin n=1 Tax=Flavobacterium granuli TaxID=280093 RepID=A0ABU1S2K5_9FLAO|nr:TonB-dependent receptor plug domain-containing protein [Flavobacterium granuli]MDR6845245.1 outer membrane receptor for ferrienterochelin and colicin [Flavobacterium granuli]